MEVRETATAPGNGNGNGGSRALAVLDAIEEILNWKKRTEEHLEKGMARLAKLLVECKGNQYWKERYPSEDEWVAAQFPVSRSQYYALLSIGTHLSALPIETLEAIGRSRAEDLVRIKRHLDSLPASWVQEAMETPTYQFRAKVREFIGETASRGMPPDESVEILRFRLVGHQIDVVHRALRLYEQILGTDKSHGFTLEMLAADCLATGRHENGDGYVQGKNWFILATCQSLLEQADRNDPAFDDRLLAMIANVIEAARPIEPSQPSVSSATA
jgi:hypothetical protein